jgi:hypothetical protein
MPNKKSYCPLCNNVKNIRSEMCKSCYIKNHKIETALCSDCNVETPIIQILFGRCKPCANAVQRKDREKLSEPEKRIVAARKTLWIKNNPERVRKTKIKSRCRKYGFSAEVIDMVANLVETQKTCDICEAHSDNCGVLHIDHDHKTHEFRGLLCSTCNTGLGHFKDNIDTLLEAIEYLKKSRS